MPSGNSVAARVLSSLSRLTGEGRWREAERLQLSWLAGAAWDYPAGHSFAMLAFEENLWSTAELVVAAQKMPKELQTLLREIFCPELTILVKTPQNTDMLAALAPFTKNYPIPERGAQYYLCQDGACAQPVNRAAELKALFAKNSRTHVDGQNENHPV